MGGRNRWCCGRRGAPGNRALVDHRDACAGLNGVALVRQDLHEHVRADDQPPVLYVRYDVPETATIKQQEFDTARLPVRERDGRASLMSSKKIAFIGTAKPKDWDDALTGPKGTYMDF